MRRASVIVNPAAGSVGSSSDLQAMTRALESHFELAVFETTPDRDARACAELALLGSPELMIAVGGDGTVSMVASALIGAQVALGIVARGTSNSIATALGIPVAAEDVLRTLVEGEPRVLDTARANGRTMVLHASLGLHAVAVSRAAPDAKKRLGVLAYLKEGLATAASFEPFDLEVETEDAIVRCRATNVAVANFAPAKTVLAQGPRALLPDDGRLDVTIVAATGLAEAVLTGLHLLRSAVQGEPATRDNIGFLSARKVRLDSDPVQPLLIDGEEAGEGRLIAECVPHSLKVLVPLASAPPAPSSTGEEKLEGLPDLEIEPKA